MNKLLKSCAIVTFHFHQLSIFTSVIILLCPSIKPDINDRIVIIIKISM